MVITVLGLGLIGGSLALTLAGRGVDVIGYDADPHTLRAAAERGLTVAGSIAEAMRGADLVILAVPLRQMGVVAQAVADHLDLTEDATVMDVGSAKGAVRAQIETAGLGERFVGAHPMAGSERSGFAAASVDLLPGATWVVTPAVDPARVRQVCAVILGPLGGRVRELTDAEHDAAVALVSHLPHVLAVELLNLVTADGPGALDLAAGSFRDVSRVGFTDPDRTGAMLSANAAALAPVVAAAAADLGRLAQALAAADEGAITAFVHAADSLRAGREVGAERAARGEPWPSVRLTV